MKIQLIPSAVGGASDLQFLMTCVVNDCVAIDAGCLGYLAPLERQRRIEHVFLSHSHADHIASLPLFLDNVYKPTSECPTVYASPAVWDCLRQDVFNDRIWPDLVRLSREETPFLRPVFLESGKTVTVGSLRITPYALQHVVATMGFLIEDDRTAVATVWDTLPTDGIWEHIRDNPRLRAVFLEASFPNSFDWLARKAGHLTPELLSREWRKLRRDVALIVVHIKPAFYDAVTDELEALNLPTLQIGQPGKTYEF
ncbi:MAG: 3',5'-cyclic-nucleotide phosphodiesterase [Pirellulaceae bacterium]|nr:3',5'-cyclic-nucleotide phosphodiesterase [Pirellulaceae bacterium]